MTELHNEVLMNSVNPDSPLLLSMRLDYWYITGKVDKIFRKELHDGCFVYVIVAGVYVKLRSIYKIESVAIDVLVDIHNVEVNRDLISA